MKPLVITAVLTILIVAGGCLTLYAIDAESQRLYDNLSTLEKDIENQNWEDALKKLEEFHVKWDKTSSFWSMLIDHYEIDNIELLLSQLASYVKTKDRSEALSQMSSLKTLIMHIPDKESFKLQNIF